MDSKQNFFHLKCRCTYSIQRFTACYFFLSISYLKKNLHLFSPCTKCIFLSASCRAINNCRNHCRVATVNPIYPALRFPMPQFQTFFIPVLVVYATETNTFTFLFLKSVRLSIRLHPPVSRLIRG